VVTITVLNGASPPGGSNAVEVKAGETAEVKFTYDSSAGPGVSGQLYLEITQDNLTFTINGDKLTPGFYSNGADSRGNPMIAGPALIKLKDIDNSHRGFATIQITPESFPPDKTLIIPAGSGALIRFQCSTNLIDWTTLYSNTYTNVPSSKFFRIAADRLP
jgi:hypothetical protein